MTKEVGRSYSQSPSTSCSKPTAFRLPGLFLVRFSLAKVYCHSSSCSCDSSCSYGCSCDSGCSVGWSCGISVALLWTNQAKTGHRSKALAAAKCAFCFMVQMHRSLSHGWIVVNSTQRLENLYRFSISASVFAYSYLIASDHSIRAFLKFIRTFACCIGSQIIQMTPTRILVVHLPWILL